MIQPRKRQKYALRLLIGIITAMSILTPLNVFAQGTYDPSFFSSNDINLYNPTDVGCSSSASSSLSATSLTGADNEEKIYNFWIGQGLSPAQAAGITGSLQAESGFSPFRQETTQTWPAGGYGIAQFTGGQRAQVTDALQNDPNITSDIYTQYYVADYGGAVNASSGFIPKGVPVDVNDKFLLSELNYLSSYTSTFSPAASFPTRATALTADYSLTITKDQKLLDYIKTLTSADDVAKAWTYLYEYPADIKTTAAARATNADAILAQYNSANSACASTGGAIVCPGSNGDTFTTGDGSIAAMVSTAKCITTQPPAGSKSSRDLAKAACTSGGCTKGPTTPPNYAAARLQYKTAGSSGNQSSAYNYGADCGNFISTVMRMSGADPNYPIVGVSTMYSYMLDHPEKYQKVTITSSTAGLQPGDILTETSPDYNGHIIMYLGDGYIAQASQGEEMPAQQIWWGMPGTVWRMIK